MKKLTSYVLGCASVIIFLSIITFTSASEQQSETQHLSKITTEDELLNITIEQFEYMITEIWIASSISSLSMVEMKRAQDNNDLENFLHWCETLNKSTNHSIRQMSEFASNAWVEKNKSNTMAWGTTTLHILNKIQHFLKEQDLNEACKFSYMDHVEEFFRHLKLDQDDFKLD